MSKRITWRAKLTLLAAATLVCLLVAEGVARLLGGSPRLPLGQLSYATADGTPVADLTAAIQLGLIEMVMPPLSPRPRGKFRGNQDFYLCYSDQAELQRDWFDDQGRVLVHINAAGIRDRDDITFDKPVGQLRVLCIGDSFTFGWGVRDEDGWVRRLETELRRSGKDIRTVNCGAAGALCVDEYAAGLANRFHRFQPDLVLVTLCLNDLIPSSGLYVEGPAPDTGSRLLDLLLAAAGHGPLDLDPTIDWVGILEALPEGPGTKAQLYGDDKPFAAMWSQGVPQASLRAMDAWCRSRNIKLLVSIWPFLQGLGPNRRYALESIHRKVAADCAAANIPLLDLLPVLRGTRHEELWVTPGDMHANPKAMALAAPAITEFVRSNWPPAR